MHFYHFCLLFCKKQGKAIGKNLRMKGKKVKKSLRNLSKSEALMKEGGYLLSRIALQYHRRK